MNRLDEDQGLGFRGTPCHLGISHGNGLSIFDFLLLPLPHGHIDPVRMAVAHEEKITEKPGGIEFEL